MCVCVRLSLCVFGGAILIQDIFAASPLVLFIFVVFTNFPCQNFVLFSVIFWSHAHTHTHTHTYTQQYIEKKKTRNG